MKDFFTWIKNFFGGVAHIFFSFIAQAIPLDKQIILNDLAPLAAAIVQDLNNQDMTWQEKRDAALSQLTAAVLKAGWDIAISDMNLAIELAVTNMKTHTSGNQGNLPGGNTDVTPVAPVIA